MINEMSAVSIYVPGTCCCSI